MTADPVHTVRPKVTVIVAIYKAEAFMERCARSLFGQSLDDIEYLFIDDGSPDRSVGVLEEVLADYPQRQSQVVLHRMERNSGQAAVREWGLRHASGEFVTHCDSDDWVEPDMYLRMYDLAVREKADIVVCDYEDTDGGSVLGVHRGCTDTDRDAFARNMLIQKDSWSLCNKLVRRSLCCREDIVFPRGDLGEDMALMFQMLVHAGKIACLPRTFYHYFAHPASITHAATEEKRMSCFRQNQENADLVFDLFRREGLLECYDDGIVYAKWCIKRQLWLTRFDKEKYRLWQATYPEIDRRIPFSPHVSFREKVKFLLTGLRLYPFRQQ